MEKPVEGDEWNRQTAAGRLQALGFQLALSPSDISTLIQPRPAWSRGWLELLERLEHTMNLPD